VSSTSTKKSDPPELDLIRAFVNTRDIDDDEDELTSVDALDGWLRARGLSVDRPLTPGDLERAVGFREALRALLLANNGRPLERDTLAALRDAAQASPLQVAIGTDGRATVEPARTAVEELTARVLAAIAEAQAAGTWERLKACPADDCQWAFYDHSRNRSRTWCSMEVCGNRTKTRSYRARKAKG
jgi:predicted RNA-binding Zn ribbon-like protein